MAETNTATNQEILSEWLSIVNEGRFDRVPEVWAADLVLHAGSALGEAHGIEGMGEVFGTIATAFPDVQVSPLQLISEGDRVAAYYTVTATHSGDYFGVEATGRSIEFTAFGIYRFADGKIAEAWAFDDALTIFDQIGALPIGS